jgi:hypothetical protein
MRLFIPERKESPVPSSHATIRGAVATTRRVRDESDHRAPQVSVVGDRVPHHGATDEGVPPVSEPGCTESQRARVRGQPVVPTWQCNRTCE